MDYQGYIIACYGVAGVALGATCLWVYSSYRSAQKRLAKLQAMQQDA